MPEWLLKELQENEAVRRLTLEGGELPLTSLTEEALVISASYMQKPRGILVVKQNLYQAQRLYERIASFLSEDECALFGADESLRVEAIASSPEMTAAKVDTMSSLLQNSKQIVVTCPSGLLRQLPFPEDFRKGCVTIRIGDIVEPEQLKRTLRAGGYLETAHIDQPLSFAARGGIIDVYSINYDSPVRLEFFDNEIDSIRFFDPSTQKTVNMIDEVRIVPASDLLFSEEQIDEIETKAQEMLKEKNDLFLSGIVEGDISAMRAHIREQRMYPYMTLLSKTACIADYMEHPLILVSDYEAVKASIKHLTEDTVSYIQEMVQEGKMLPKYAVWHDFERLAPYSKRMCEDPLKNNISNISEADVPNETLEVKLNILNRPGRKVFVLSDKEADIVKDTLKEMNVSYKTLRENGTVPEGFSFYNGKWQTGFVLKDKDIHVYTSHELFEIHHHVGRYEKKFRNAEVIHTYQELDPGDYIVHAQYGVGQYMGIVTKDANGNKKDFLKVIYRGNAELLVPLEQFRRVRKFVSREGVVPRLNKLGSGEWEKTKARLQENINEIAERLVSLYANREQHIGHAFSGDNEYTLKFENAFPYELTPDQKKAVEDIKKDMENDKPMDRLVCGDVGFGKTEVAVRASFKAVSDGYQTAVLCPTTILAEQHFHTFEERYRGFPVTIRVLDRFQTPAQVKDTLKGLSEGRVDIVVGTHRLLSNDVHFKKLGLLVVDEEQRFGVEHKEKIKEMKNGIDVLTLSATPIPRTLQMSLVGIRQLSQLETPPNDRYNIQTYVVERNKGLIIDAIEKELAREGQVFFLHNNIEQIYNIARSLRNSIPTARIGIVHGKMDREDIEDTMMRFTNHELDVLVCTTIVENGIDIPNANTILIDNAQDFGLSQIYQIKGRVGRSNRVAYAYLLIPERRQLTEVATKRLQAVKEFATLGSGYNIAMRDLTIRGAGDLLGPSQSGFIDTVGIDMYIEMLEEAIHRQKDPSYITEEKELKHANVSKSGYIPEKFSPDDYDKLEMYQKIDALRDMNSLQEYRNDVVDQYGKLPEEVALLFDKKKLDILLNEAYLDSYKEIKGQCQITFSSLFSQKLDGIKLFEIFSEISKDIRLRYTGGKIIADIPKGKDSLKLCIEAIERAREAER